MEDYENLDIYQSAYDKWDEVNCLIYSIKDICMNLEFKSQYYENENFKYSLSKERNRYITLLSLAQDKIYDIEELNKILEQKLT